jgi:electron transfer flavoprotein beta subunit
MPTVLVAVKHVPVGGAFLRAVDGRLTREGISHGIDPINEVALEWALRGREAGAFDRVVAVTMGPDGAVDTLRQALALGADDAVHVCDDLLAGADIRTTARVIAAVAAREDAQLVALGYESLDSSSGAVPAAIAACLGWPVVSRFSAGQVVSGSLSGERDLGSGLESVEVALPAVVSLVEGHVTPRYPKLKQLLAAKSRAVVSLSAADLGVVPAAGERVVGLVEVAGAAKAQRILGLEEGVDELIAVLAGEPVG